MDTLSKIKKFQKERDWIEYRLAKKSGLTQSTISGLYRKTNSPTLPTLEALCKAFGITMSQFFAEGNIPVDLTDEQRKMLERWNQLNPKQKHAVSEIMDAM